MRYNGAFIAREIFRTAARRPFFAFVCILLYAPSLHAADVPQKRKPNIVVITDDQGYGNLSCHGNPILKKPNIDKLHSCSVRFLDFNVSPTCAPTRAALFTGRHEFRSGVTHTINERERLGLSASRSPNC